MLAFDASSMIFAWDYYPVKQFPPTWDWIAKEIEVGEFVIARIAFEEVAKKMPDCADFLKTAGITQNEIGNDILQEAVRIKTRLGIINDDFHPDGVNENDILIIATAKIENLELVSDESKQATQPKENRKLKIPAVCQLPDVGVPCCSFIELIKRSGEVFR